MTTLASPWYREFWPWFIIGLLGSCVIACFMTLAIAIYHPEALVLSEADYEAVRAELRHSNATHDRENAPD